MKFKSENAQQIYNHLVGIAEGMKIEHRKNMKYPSDGSCLMELLQINSIYHHMIKEAVDAAHKADIQERDFVIRNKLLIESINKE